MGNQSFDEKMRVGNTIMIHNVNFKIIESIGVSDYREMMLTFDSLIDKIKFNLYDDQDVFKFRQWTDYGDIYDTVPPFLYLYMCHGINLFDMEFDFASNMMAQIDKMYVNTEISAYNKNLENFRTSKFVKDCLDGINVEYEFYMCKRYIPDSCISFFKWYKETKENLVKYGLADMYVMNQRMVNKKYKTKDTLLCSVSVCECKEN